MLVSMIASALVQLVAALLQAVALGAGFALGMKLVMKK